MNIQKIIIALIIGIFQGFAVTKIMFKQVENTDKKKELLFYLIMIFYAIISFFLVPNNLRFIMFIMVIIVTLFLILKIRDSFVIVYAFNTLIILTVSEILITLLMVLFGISSVDIVNNSLYNLIANIIDSFFAIILIHLKPCKFLINKIIKLFKKRRKSIRYLYLILLILYLILVKNGLELILKSSFYINIIFMLLILVVIVMIIKNELKTEQLNDANKQMLNYVTKYEKIITEKGKANHEFKNQLMVIRGYAQMNDNNKLIDYIDLIMNDTKKTHSSYLISQLNKFPDGGIKGLLYYKLSIMNDNKINYEIEVENGVKSKLNSLATNMYNNITKILGVLLDNAIDASNRSKEKTILISVSKKKNTVVFNISNTYKGRIDIAKINEGYTTKGKGHGYGLRLVKDILNTNNKLKLDNSANDKYYTAILTILLPMKKK